MPLRFSLFRSAVLVAASIAAMFPFSLGALGCTPPGSTTGSPSGGATSTARATTEPSAASATASPASASAAPGAPGASTGAATESVPQGFLPHDDVRLAYEAYLAGRADEAKRAFRALADKSGETFGPVDLDDRGSGELAVSKRFAMLKTGQCLFVTSGGSSSRPCGDLVVDLSTRKILRYVPVELPSYDRTNAFFLGDDLVVHRGAGTRALIRLPEWRDVDVMNGEPVARIPGTTRIIVALTTSGAGSGDERAAFEVRDTATHAPVSRLSPRGPGPVGADAMSLTPVRVLLGGKVLVASVRGEIMGFDLARGTRLFSLATDQRDLTMLLPPDERTVTFFDVCDWSVRREPMPIGDGVDKAQRVRTSVCEKSKDARIDLTTGQIAWTPHDRTRIPSTEGRATLRAIPPEREPWAKLGRPLGGAFCAAGSLLVPAELCK